MSSGASAKRGDRVLNQTTAKGGTVDGSTQDGRLLVRIGKDDRTYSVEAWERWNTTVIHPAAEWEMIQAMVQFDGEHPDHRPWEEILIDVRTYSVLQS